MRETWTDAEVVTAYQSGMTFLECYREFHKLHQVRLQRILKAAGVPVRRRTARPLTDAQEQAIVAYHRQGGRSLRDTAKHSGSCVPVVTAVLKKHGVDLLTGPWSQERIDRMIAMYQSGKSVQETARLMESATKQVRKYLRQFDIPIRPHSEATPKGDKNPAWRGGRHIDKSGYVYLRRPDHPNRNHLGYVFEHRLVMEAHLGRYLTPEEVVHHRDKDKKNNAIENLELFGSNGAHLAHELKGQCPKWTEDGRARILAAVRGQKKGSRTSPLSRTDARPSS